MASKYHSASKVYVTISQEESEWLQQQTANYSGGLNISVWQQYGHNRLYVQLSGKKDKVFFDLNAETLEAGMSVALSNALIAFIEENMPVVEEVQEEVSEALEEEISQATEIILNCKDTYTFDYGEGVPMAQVIHIRRKLSAKACIVAWQRYLEQNPDTKLYVQLRIKDVIGEEIKCIA